jgi:hypothetical protein
VNTICEWRLVGSGALALFVASGVLMTGCSDDGQKTPEQQAVEQQDAQRAAPDAERAHDEATQCPEPAEEVESPHEGSHAQRGASDEDSEDSDEADMEEIDGQMWFQPGTAARTLQGRMRSRGTGLSAGEQIPGASDAVSKQPLVPPVAQPRYEFGIYMGTPDQTRGVRGLRVDSGEPPSYSTMKPVTPNVSESTVLPEMQSGSP